MTHPPGQDTIASGSVPHGKSCRCLASCNARGVKLRTPIVLARGGGAPTHLSLLARWGLASPLGSGKQWVPWIHIDDLVRVYEQALSDEQMAGVYNVAADEQPDQRTFMHAGEGDAGNAFHPPCPGLRNAPDPG